MPAVPSQRSTPYRAVARIEDAADHRHVSPEDEHRASVVLPCLLGAVAGDATLDQAGVPNGDQLALVLSSPTSEGTLWLRK